VHDEFLAVAAAEQYLAVEVEDADHRAQETLRRRAPPTSRCGCRRHGAQDAQNVKMCLTSHLTKRAHAAFPDLNFWGTAPLLAEGDYVVGQ
jgi:hypothetical protein